MHEELSISDYYVQHRDYCNFPYVLLGIRNIYICVVAWENGEILTFSIIPSFKLPDFPELKFGSLLPISLSQVRHFKIWTGTEMEENGI